MFIKPCLRRIQVAPVSSRSAVMHAVIHTFMHNRVSATLRRTPVCLCASHPRRRNAKLSARHDTGNAFLATSPSHHESAPLRLVKHQEKQGHKHRAEWGRGAPKTQKRRHTGVFLWITAAKHCGSARSYSHNRLAKRCISAVKGVFLRDSVRQERVGEGCW